MLRWHPGRLAPVYVGHHQLELALVAPLHDDVDGGLLRRLTLPGDSGVHVVVDVDEHDDQCSKRALRGEVKLRGRPQRSTNFQTASGSVRTNSPTAMIACQRGSS